MAIPMFCHLVLVGSVKDWNDGNDTIHMSAHYTAKSLSVWLFATTVQAQCMPVSSHETH